jgi:hypothetical protein
MNRLLLWITTAVLGATATLITSIGGLLGSVLFLPLATPLHCRRLTSLADAAMVPCTDMRRDIR